jgi:hypothetical protein
MNDVIKHRLCGICGENLDINAQDAARLAELLRSALTMMARKTWTKEAKALLTKLGYLSCLALALYAPSASAEDRPRQEYRLYDQQYRNKGVIRETDPNIYQMYDEKSRRTGTIYVRPDGSVDAFRPDGTRIFPTIRPSYPQPNRRSTP